MHGVMLFIHIVAAMAWLGAAIREEAARSALAKAPAVARAVEHRIAVDMGRWLFAPAAGIVLLSGIWLVAIDGDVGFGAAFVLIGVLTVIVGGALGSAVFGPKGRLAAARFDEGDVDGGAAVEASMRSLHLLQIGLLLVTVVAMIGEWGA